MEGSTMNQPRETVIRRRDLLRAVTAGVTAAAASAVPFEPAAADAGKTSGKRKAQYQANSAEVQDFYRVNRYPAR
jgi:hypothetical protein